MASGTLECMFDAIIFDTVYLESIFTNIYHPRTKGEKCTVSEKMLVLFN